MKWNPFSREKIISTIEKYNNSSTSGLDKVLWRYLKKIVKDVVHLNKFIDNANVYIDIGHWPLHFKVSSTIIIPKPNKVFYNFSNTYWPIILLNTISKLFEKVISERLQFLLISNNFIHSCQLSGLKQQSITDADIVLTYFIHMGWVKNLFTSILMFDITQFFPLLDHQLLPLILDKAGFDSKILFLS